MHAVVEQLLGAAHVHVVAHLLGDAEVADEAEVDDGVGPLGAEDVLELALAQVDLVDGDVLRPPLPGHAVDAADLEAVEKAPGEEPSLAARDAGDEDFFHCISAGLRPHPNRSARSRASGFWRDRGIRVAPRGPRVEPASRLQEVKIPLDEPVDGVAAVSGVLGVPEWWPTGSRVGVVLAHDPVATSTTRSSRASSAASPSASISRCASTSRSPRRDGSARIRCPCSSARSGRPSRVLGARSVGGARAPLRRRRRARRAGRGPGAASRLRVDGVFALGFRCTAATTPRRTCTPNSLFRVVSPMLFVQGTRDRTCDLDTLRRTLTRVGAPKTLHVIAEADSTLAVPRRSGPADRSPCRPRCSKRSTSGAAA